MSSDHEGYNIRQTALARRLTCAWERIIHDQLATLKKVLLQVLKNNSEDVFHYFLRTKIA